MIDAAVVLKAALVGVGGTVFLDLWAFFLARALSIPATNWPMVGRWIGHMPSGQFVHESLANAKPVPGEAAIGWIAHYAIGIGYGVLLFILWGRTWIAQPTLGAPLILSWALLVAPYFILMPGMGAGVAGSKTPKPNVTRLKSVVAHAIFGLGMYATALALANAWPTAD